ncbi:MAG: hypothetical protein R3B09_21015 [Nannocystaceae bacterium]
MSPAPARSLRRLVVEPGRYTYPQSELAAALRARVAALPDARPICQMVGFIAQQSGIDARHLEFEVDAIDARTDWYRLVNEATLSMARRALLSLCGGDVAELRRLDGLIAVSSSFAGFPALSRRLQADLGLDPGALCYDLAGLGCAGPTQGLFLADTLLSSGACRRVCVVCVDAMGTHGESRVHQTLPDVSQVVAHCLASDGAAAALLTAEDPDAGEPPVMTWRASAIDTRLWSDALDQNDFTASADNQPLIAVGKAIRTRFLDELAPFLTPEAVASSMFIHPGGAALMTQMAKAYPSLEATVARSSHVLRTHGNVGSASVLFVLADALERDTPLTSECRLLALGPGIVSTLLTLQKVEVPT